MSTRTHTPPEPQRPLPPRLWVFGEALVDEFEDAAVAGGAPFNLARHLCGLGATVTLISRVGSDAHGAHLLQEAQDFGLAVDGLQLDKMLPSGRVQVQLDPAGQPSYTIVEPAAWDAIEPIAPAHAADVVALGSLALRRNSSRESAWALLRAAPSAKRFVDINLRPTGPGIAVIDTLLHEAHWLKVNESEVTALAQQLELPSAMDGFAHAMHERYRVEELLVTLGERGCMVSQAATELHEVRGAPASGMVDAVGAGDGFSAAWLMMRLRGADAASAARFANRYGASICGFRGPMPTAHERDAHFEHWRTALNTPAIPPTRRNTTA